MPQKRTIPRTCLRCGTVFLVTADNARPGRGLYCSRPCANTGREKADLATRFWPKVGTQGPKECWPWVGSMAGKGYGHVWDGVRTVPAHRVAWELTNGPIPDGMEIDHVRTRGCILRNCCNPAHLEPVTHETNVQRGRNARAEQTHCKRGHPFTHENTYVASGGRRVCKTCRRRHDQNRQCRVR